MFTDVQSLGGGRGAGTPCLQCFFSGLKLCRVLWLGKDSMAAVQYLGLMLWCCSVGRNIVQRESGDSTKFFFGRPFLKASSELSLRACQAFKYWKYTCFPCCRGLHSWILQYLCLTSMGTLPECGIRSTELLPTLCVKQKCVHTSQPNAMAVALLSQQCLVNPAKQGAPHALGTVPFSGCRLWLLLWLSAAQASFCVGLVTLVSDYFYVLLCHPVEGLDSGGLWDVETWLCMAEGKE